MVNIKHGYRGRKMFYLTVYSANFTCGNVMLIILRKEGNVLFNDTLNTIYLFLYGKGPFR